MLNLRYFQKSIYFKQKNCKKQKPKWNRFGKVEKKICKRTNLSKKDCTKNKNYNKYIKEHIVVCELFLIKKSIT